MTTDELVDYWLGSSNSDFRTMMNLFESKDYHWSLFIGHLVIEKLMKAVYIQRTNSENPPRTHDLQKNHGAETMVDHDVREQINKIALKFAENLQNHIQIHSLYVYGSYANGTYREDSDIDIAVIADGFTGDLIEDTFMLMKMRRKVDNRIEPHPFPVNEFNENDPMAKEVMRTGIRIM